MISPFLGPDRGRVAWAVLLPQQPHHAHPSETKRESKSKMVSTFPQKSIHPSLPKREREREREREERESSGYVEGN